MTKRKLLVTTIAATLAVSGNAFADGKGHSDFNFQHIETSADAANRDAAAPWKLPRGFSQTVVSDESDLNICDGGRDDWNNINTVNETGHMAGMETGQADSGVSVPVRPALLLA